jgi:hypothetical protein
MFFWPLYMMAASDGVAVIKAPAPERSEQATRKPWPLPVPFFPAALDVEPATVPSLKLRGVRVMASGLGSPGAGDAPRLTRYIHDTYRLHGYAAKGLADPSGPGFAVDSTP